jgi:hypothetical protein
LGLAASLGIGRTMTAGSIPNPEWMGSLDRRRTFDAAVDITAHAFDLTPEAAETFLRNGAAGIGVPVDGIAAEIVRSHRTD